MSLRFGIMGVGKMAGSTTKAIKEASGAEAVAVGSRSQDKADAFANEHDLAYAFSSYEDLLASDQVDAIYVGLPINLHKQWSMKALDAGKAVLCEKSLCLTVDDAIEMYQAAQRNNKVLREVMSWHYHLLREKVQELVQAGAIGDVRVVHADFHTPTSDYDNIRFKKECGGGAMRDLGVYCIDALRMFFASEPEQMQAQMRMGPTGVDEQSAGVLQFEQGIGYFSCSLKTTFACRYEITGSNGRIRVNRGATVCWDGEEFKIELESNGKEETLVVPACNPYQQMIESFVEACAAGSLEDPQQNNSVGNIRVIERIFNQQQVAV